MRRRYRRSSVIVVAACLLIVLALRLLGPEAGHRPSAPSEPPSSARVPTTTGAAVQTWRVLRVVDGDTVRVLYERVDESVRLLHINTPERGQPGYRESTEAMRGLVEGKHVRLEFVHQNTCPCRKLLPAHMKETPIRIRSLPPV